jgi:site-specific DNA recombinase
MAATAERRVAYYLRVSTEEQAENPEGSIKNQEERLKLALAFKNAGDTRCGTLEGVYCDIGRSGKDMNRPELQRLLNAIERGDINLVMVSELSRLSRSIRDFSQMWEFMQVHGCGFMSLRENFDTSTAAGEMMLYSIANFAQFERRQTSERVSANFLSRAQRGLWNGGVLPLGYTPDPDQKGSLKIIEEEAEVVRAAFRALLDQGSVSAAAKWLNQKGYSYRAPLRGGGGKPRNRHFTFDSLYRLLSNPSYIGVRQIRVKNKAPQSTQAVWPAMIDEATFKKAQALLEAGRRQKTGRESRYPYLLSTRIVCGQCQAPLVGVSAYGKTTKVPYYGHGTQVKREQLVTGLKARCAPFRIPGKKIEARVWDEVLSLIESPSHRLFPVRSG